jgi:hypothetical protein
MGRHSGWPPRLALQRWRPAYLAIAFFTYMSVMKAE